jgi:hypothetical protein
VLDHIVANPGAAVVKDILYMYVALLLLFFENYSMNPVKDLFQPFHLICLCTPSGYNALLLSSMNGHRDVCELLISSGAEVNAKGGWYMSPFVYFVKTTL